MLALIMLVAIGILLPVVLIESRSFGTNDASDDWSTILPVESAALMNWNAGCAYAWVWTMKVTQPDPNIKLPAFDRTCSRGGPVQHIETVCPEC